MKTTLLTMSAIGCLAGVLAAQSPAKPELERALTAFRQGDVDQDGKLSAREAQALGISDEVAKRFDDDADTNIARDEFLLYYHDLLVQAGQPAGTELETEVGRIQAVRRAREARRQERERAAQTGERPADERAARARADLRGQDANAPVAASAATQADAAAALTAAFDRLEQRILDGIATRADYDVVRDEVRRVEQGWIARARRAARQGDQQAAQSGADQARAGSALMDAIDDLERRASAGQIVDSAELGQLKNRLIARARQAAGQSEQAGGVPSARAAAARSELAGRGAQQDPLTTDAALNAALDRLEQRVLNGEAKRDEFKTLRERFIARARSGSANGAQQDTLSAPGSSRLVAALDDLEQKFLAGTVARSDFRSLRELMIRSAREASSTNAAADTAVPSVRAQQARAQLADEQQGSQVAQKAAPKPATRLMIALSQLEARALGGKATPDDYQQLRQILIQKARQAVNGGEKADGITADSAREMQRTLDTLEAKAGSAQLTQQDFDELRAMLERPAADEARGTDGPAQQRSKQGDVDASRGDARSVDPARQVRPPQEEPSDAGRGSSGEASRGDGSKGSTPPQGERGAGDGIR